MVTQDICRQIARGVGDAFSCLGMGAYVQVRTPFLYPDGRIIDLYIRTDNDRWTATDLGETHRWLDAHSWSDKRTAGQQELVRQVCATLGLDEFRGALVTKVDDPAHAAEAVTRLAQGAMRVADLWLTFRAKVIETVRDQVAEYLDHRKIAYERQIVREGKSKTQWKIDFETRLSKKTSWIQVLTTGSRGAAAQIRDHTVAAWVDLGGENGTELISLFDDSLNIWREEDVRQLEAVSTVAFWSNPEDFVSHLGMPA